MRAYAVDPEHLAAADVVGRVLCHDVVAVGESGRVKLGKGRYLTAEDLPALRTYPHELHVLELEDADVHEDLASTRLARAVAGPGIALRGPHESQTSLRAAERGLFEVDTAALECLNLLPDVSVFTTYTGRPVDAGTAVGSTKVTPLAVPRSVIEEAERIAAGTPVTRVSPFGKDPVGVIVRERLTANARDKFEAAIHMKLGWFESPIAGIRYLPEDTGAIAAALEGFLADGVALILAAGVNSTDPLDLTLQALDRVGAVTEKRGVPAHPGSTCWLAYARDTPVFGLALCGMFSKTTVLDLLLPRFLSGRPVRSADLARLGHGGLLGREMAFRFPNYGASHEE